MAYARLIAFDRPLDIELLSELADNIAITYGKHVRAGDRFESFRPGYEFWSQYRPIYGPILR